MPGYLSYLTGMSGTAVTPDSDDKGGPPPPGPAARGSGGRGRAVATTTGPSPPRRAAGPVAAAGAAGPCSGTLLFVLGFSVVFAVEALALSSRGADPAR